VIQAAVKAGSAQPPLLRFQLRKGRHQRFRHDTGRRSDRSDRPAVVAAPIGRVAASGWTEGSV